MANGVAGVGGVPAAVAVGDAHDAHGAVIEGDELPEVDVSDRIWAPRP